MATMFRATPRFYAAMRPSSAMFMRQSPQMYMRQTLRLRTPVPKEEQSAHTISQRLRTLKSLPAELIPLGIVVAIAVGFACFSLGKTLIGDKTLRLKRQGADK
ncbi:hypothetical protein BU24DRAFT_420090 [Aaosphaeria arxii CBS 175.79]|uniref:Uncharacterized protein n=1 Tax=Aaosphaeria arxii CBS 175.79 TaxID=1450172 RepID=A0A6A5XV19_9PLEO|nr:uncharacterized protein BU24DRAFT_420090 [Aaosphaeria arxii CBS 175.79]KAF2017062.1 hypothetical protein BU24DRAFT_420090 [Aaosphaeria arxii CBS 175.79]